MVVTLAKQKTEKYFIKKKEAAYQNVSWNSNSSTSSVILADFLSNLWTELAVLSFLLLSLFHSSFIYFRAGVVVVLPEVPLDGFRKVLTTALRALPVMESDVPSRLKGVDPGRPAPLDAEEVRALHKQGIS